MADWKKYLEDRTITMEEAAKKVNSGDTMWLGNTLTIPYAFMDAIAERHEELKNVTIIGNMFLGMNQIMLDTMYKKSFQTISIFPNMLERMAAMECNIDFNSVPYEWAVESVSDVYKTNVVCLEVCPPDEDGTCNAGLLGTCFSPDIFRHDNTKLRIGVINGKQPRASGDPDLVKYPVEMFDFFVYNEHDIPAVPPSEPTEHDKAISSFIMPYIKNGDKVQIGMGGLGNQIAKELITFKDMKVFTEIGTDAMIELAEAGVVTEIKMGGAFGTAELYKWLGDHPEIVSLISVKEIFGTLKEVEDLVAINATFMVDITGQCCSEAQGLKQYSAIGGSHVFLMDTPKGKGNRSFLCLRSTYVNSETKQRLSNVVSALPAGVIVSTPRYLPMYLVSEYGVADVYLRSNKDRINAIIPIAHPDYREALKSEAIEYGLMAEDDFKF